ncbi:S1 RNA-binding domain-containing protein [Streptomyces sp. PA5.6]|uniref:S1 RNA-binding domain-containing protein n=1 Tax=Streptomyces sp. PA5.6 TaxID=3035651 RepID=UPI0039046CC1
MGRTGACPAGHGPSHRLADSTVGQTQQGQVTKLVPFGAFVQATKDVEGLIHLQETPLEGCHGSRRGVLQIGDEVEVVITEIDRERSRLALCRRQASTALGSGQAASPRG